MVLLALAGLSGTAAAGLSPESSADRVEARRLAEIRERLERGRALQRSLQTQVDGLAGEIEDLKVRLDQTLAMLQSHREEARALERRLDRLVPRVLARTAEVRERREAAARTLADLAGRSRSVRLEPRTRARTLALSPLMLNRLLEAEAGLAVLRERQDQTMERHAEVERRLPALASAHQDLERMHAKRSRLRQAGLDRLRGLQVEVKLLGEEHMRLAEHLVREEAASAARADPQANQQALPAARTTGTALSRSAPALSSASVDKGVVDPPARLTRVADARDRREAQVVAEALKPADGFGSTEPAVTGAPTRRPARPGPPQARLGGESPAASPSGPGDAIGRATALDVVFVPQAGPSERAGDLARGARDAIPVLHLPEALQRQGVALGRPELTIAAAPGQGVAAPVDGKVVFAGRFKSYGLLLILEHEGEYHTLLWGFARLDVERGDRVHVGQLVGIMGARGDDPPMLHVERRRNGRPINLAASSNGIQG